MKKKHALRAVCAALPLLLLTACVNARDTVSNAASHVGDAVSDVGEGAGSVVSDIGEGVSNGIDRMDGQAGDGSVDRGDDGFLDDEDNEARAYGSPSPSLSPNPSPKV